MLTFISPAKQLDETPQTITQTHSKPAFLQESKMLLASLEKMDEAAIASLMHISPKLAELNHKRYQAMNGFENITSEKQALFLFKGDVYKGLRIDSYTQEDCNYLQSHLRILSGFYGLLRPLDTIFPYRLEMGTSLKNALGKDLYAFWQKRLTDHINEIEKPNFIVNLASNEYWKAINDKTLLMPVIHCQFKEEKDGKYKTIGLFAKRARGEMVDYMREHQIRTLEPLKSFDRLGYQFNSELSDDNHYIFTRKQP